MTTTANEINFAQIHAEATAAAAQAAKEFLAKHGDRDACGFAWVTVYGVKLNTRLGKVMKALGFRSAYGGGIQLWNPSGAHTQAITAKEEGAQAYAAVLKRYGITAYAGSRMD